MRPATVDDIEAVACLLLPPASKRAAVDLLRREVVCGLARDLPQQPSGDLRAKREPLLGRSRDRGPRDRLARRFRRD